MMTLLRLAIFSGLCLGAVSSTAGTLTKDGWEPSECGLKPIAPALNYDSVPGFNDSVAAINAWQQEALVYYSCMTKEANADVKRIHDKVEQQQKDHKDLVESINAETLDVKQRVENAPVVQPGQ